MSTNTTYERLSSNLVLQQWSKTYNKEGKPDWSHIFPFYADDIVFHDTIQRLEGKEKFKELCARLTKRCQSLHMDLSNVIQHDNVIFFEWTMTMAFRKWPSTAMYGTTRLTLNDDGLIKEQRDYYDLWGDIFNNVPRFKKMYRKFLRKYFG
jgi:ketosteroid isomerase-like protein